MNERMEQFATPAPAPAPAPAPRPGQSPDESYNPWSVVNLVFEHLVDQGLHPVLGDLGDPSGPARALLETLGIEPRAEGNREVMNRVRSQLDELRSAVFETP